MYQKIIILGNLGGDPELRYTAQGTAVANFSVATNRKWTNTDGSAGEETCWFRVTAWQRLAEVCDEYLSKGRQVMVEGKLTPDPDTGGPKIWQRKDGESAASFEIRASVVQFLGKGNGNGKPVTEEADDMPF